MIEYVTGNLLEADAEAIVNTVNTVGVMGKGVALQFRRAFPENYEAYAAAAAREQIVPGRMFTWESDRLEKPRYIINFPTKRHWRGRSRLQDIEAGLDDLRRVLIEHDVRSAALPALGCGLGGLDWSDVRERIEAALGDLPIRILVYPPQAAPAPRAMPDASTRPKLTTARAALIGLLARYLEPGDRATLLEAQKLLYFLQEAGEPLRLAFAKQQYGPYADNARHLLRHLEGHYLEGYGDGTSHTGISLLPDAAKESEAFLEQHPSTLKRFDRVRSLIDGFESPYGLELLSTTHWAATREGADDADHATEQVQAWSPRKDRLFTPDHVQLAWERLAEGGWLSAARTAVPV
jgi:O-acetyl-ADP-ribose deacetylase (regulator of RNase III)